MDKVKYAIIGFGGIAENRVAKEGYGCDKARFNGLPNAELVGATDLNPAREEAAKALGLKWYKSIDELLADPEIAAVYVATNNASHAAMTIKALDAGKHVIVEKPTATTVADAEAMMEAAKKHNLSLYMDHMMVGNAYNQLAKDYIRKGAIGNVTDSCFHMEFLYGSTPEEAHTWRCNNIAEMGGPIGDVASHCMYTAEFMFDSAVKAVQAVYLPKTLPIKAEDGAYIKFEMENGMTGSIKCAFSEGRGGLVGTISNLGFEAYGDKGVLRGFGTLFQLSGHKDEPYRIRLELETADGVTSPTPDKVENIYQKLITRHAQSIIDNKPMNVEDGLRNLKFCLACHKSAQEGGIRVEVK